MQLVLLAHPLARMTLTSTMSNVVAKMRMV
jgi:hypothetical protein